jgi:very-short-patch-repair endonuclease
MRFGPLNRKGGERRLNVGITRAKVQMTVISSLRAEHIDLNRTKAQGAKLLRNFLDFAEQGPIAIKAAVQFSDDAEHDSEFEAEVERALVAAGLMVRRQIGCGKFRIDLGIIDPARPGCFVLGVECDGATYHSSATARDRDRLRQEVLEGLGWRICRIWSTDWIRNPQRQIEKVLASYNAAIVDWDEEAESSRSMPNGKNGPEVKEKPILRVRREEDDHRTAIYSDIDAVHDSVILECILKTLKRYGQTSKEDLIKSVSRQLGFQRTGQKIQQKLTAGIDCLALQGRISLKEDSGVDIARSTTTS